MIDPLAPFMRCESHSRSMLETLLPLRALSENGLSREMSWVTLFSTTG